MENIKSDEKQKIFKERINEAITFLFENNLIKDFEITINEFGFHLISTRTVTLFEEEDNEKNKGLSIFKKNIDKLFFRITFSPLNEADYFLWFYFQKSYRDENGSWIIKIIEPVAGIYQDFKKIPFKSLLDKIKKNDKLFDIQNEDDLKKYFLTNKIEK